MGQAGSPTRHCHRGGGEPGKHVGARSSRVRRQDGGGVGDGGDRFAGAAFARDGKARGRQGRPHGGARSFVNAGSRSVEIDVPRQDIWKILVAPGRRDWYYRLNPLGDFAEGSHVSWVDIDGKAVEESDVVAVEPERRLELRTRFVFSSSLAAAAHHSVIWELTGEGDRCAVRLTWAAEGPAAKLLASETQSQLAGLR